MKKQIFALWTLAAAVCTMCGFAAPDSRMPTGDTRPFGLIVAILVVSALLVVGLIIFLVIRSKKGGKNTPAK